MRSPARPPYQPRPRCPRRRRLGARPRPEAQAGSAAGVGLADVGAEVAARSDILGIVRGPGLAELAAVLGIGAPGERVAFGIELLVRVLGVVRGRLGIGHRWGLRYRLSQGCASILAAFF